jgi:hypothetical protein
VQVEAGLARLDEPRLVRQSVYTRLGVGLSPWLIAIVLGAVKFGRVGMK